MRSPVLRLAVIAALALSPLAARAQEPPAGHPPVAGEAPKRGADAAPGERNRDAQRAAPRPQTDDSTTRHTLALPDRSLAFTATVGTVRLRDEASEPLADIAYAYYRLDGDAAARPIVFLFNGGPGSASAWLQLGAVGPWRIAMTGPNGEAASPSAAPELLPNAETWLDFADLVFVDPVGTGFSRFATRDEKARKTLYSVDGDARAVARAIRLIALKHERLISPKYVVGESYGGLRGPKVAHHLVEREGVGLRGLLLVSPLFDMREFGGSSLLAKAFALPSMVAVARAAKGPVTRADLSDVEAYASGEFLADMMRGPADVAAADRLSARVAGLTGLDPVETRRLNGRVGPTEFRRLFDRAHGRVLGRYDASVTGYDPFPDSTYARFPDPSSDPLIPLMTSAVTELTTRRLGWKTENLYRLLANDVNRAWDWGAAVNPPESLTQLREILALDAKLKLHVAHGLFDLATPYFASQVLLAQLPDFGRDRVTLSVHSGGHMFYSRDAGRRALRAEAEAVMK